MLLLAVVLAAHPAFANLPPCTSERELTPKQAAFGAELDQADVAAPALTPSTIRGGGELVDYARQAWASDAADARSRGAIRAGACSSRIIVVGVVRARSFVLSPARRFIWGEHELEVEQVVRQDAAAPVAVGERIVVARMGGTVCTAVGQLQAVRDTQAPLVVGGRYLLFLTPKHGRFVSSDFDWRLEDTQARRAGVDDHAQTITPAELLARVNAVGPCGE